MILVLTLLAALVGAESSEHYHIVPVNSTALCQHYPNGTCFTLDQLSSQVTHTGDITISFLPGEHLLTQNITFINRSDITLNSAQLDNFSNSNASRISCVPNTGIKVADTDTFTLQGLVIYECNRYDDGGVISLLRTTVVIKSTSFQNNSIVCHKQYNCYAAVLATVDSTVTIDSCVFEYNTAVVSHAAVVKGAAVVITTEGTLHIINSTFIHNRAVGNSGHIIFLPGTTAVIKNTVFQNNSIVCPISQCFDAAVLTFTTVTIDSCVFQYNQVDDGANVVVTRKGKLHNMNSTFKYNRVGEYGGVVFVEDAVVQITHSTFEINNGTTLKTLGELVVLQITHSIFQYNIANDYGTVTISSGTISDTVFKYNTGTAIWIGGPVHITNSSFEHNTAADSLCGGAVRVDSSAVAVHITDTTFSNNIAPEGGAVCLTEQSEMTLDTIVMSNNKATSDGGAVYIEQQSTLNIIGDVTITKNSAAQAGGGIFSVQSIINLNNGDTQILSNIAKQDGGGVHLTATGFTINVNLVTLTIDSNTAQNYGGGFYLQGNSQLRLKKYPDSLIDLTNNTAARGGAIYVSDSSSGLIQCSEFDTDLNEAKRTLKQCFVKWFHGWGTDLAWTRFANNSAIESGSDIYGGLLDRCIMDHINLQYLYTGIDFISKSARFSWAPDSHIQTINQLYNHISSDPVRVCFCQNDIVNCSYTHPTVFKKKGETFTLSVAAVDQVGKPVNATLISSLPLSDNSRLKTQQQFRTVGDQCTDLEYNVYSSDSIAFLQVYADGPCGNHGISKQDVNITFQLCTCPIGLDKTQDPIDCSCDCAKELKPHISNCSPENKTIQINENIWIEHINNTNSTKQFVTQTCPFDYCVQKPVNISLANQTEADKQCAFDRTGRLCSQCAQRLSLVFASSRCQHCSNYYLFLLLPFALAGIALVAFILLLNITVASGTIHGLIFYANILAANHSIFLPFETGNFLTVFISWLNLDLGIQTCFYNGMDSYGKFLLQLVFPAYVFLLITIIMVLCNRSQRIAGLFGKKNSEATLYTLMLLSYSKLIRIIITALQFTVMDYPHGEKVFWLFDANIPYLKASHIPRFLAAFIITILGAVYTTLLLFGQLFNRCSEYRLMNWTTHRYYIHFLKAHHAPLSDKHRYWVGLLLLIKSLCYLIAIFSPEAVTVLSAAVFVFSLILYKLVNKQIYTKRSIDLLETIQLLNTSVLALVTYFTSGVRHSQQVLATVSMSISFIAFLSIVLYHILDTCGVKLGELPNKVLTKLKQHQHYQPVAVIEEQSEDEDELLIQLDKVHNYADNDMENSKNDPSDPARYITPPIIRSAMPTDQLREPALDDLIPVRPEDYNALPVPRPQRMEPTFTEIIIRAREID